MRTNDGWLFALVLIVPLLAQQPLAAQRVRALGLTEASFAEGFTNVVGVHELADGRVLVADSHERVVYLLDSRLSARGRVGRSGQGPGEYLGVRALFLGMNGGAAVYDDGNRRLLVIDPLGNPGAVLDPDGCSDQVRRSAAEAADGVGRYYAAGLPVPGARGTRAIERWMGSDGCERDVLANVPTLLPEGSAIVAGILLRTTDGQAWAFPAETEWAVSASGVLAVVHPDPYRVEFVGEDGTARSGPVIRHDPVPVSEGHKEWWRVEYHRPRPMIRMMRDMTSTLVLESPQTTEPRWPEFLPPFLPNTISFAPNGNLWIGRTVRANAPPLYDVIGPTGSVVEQIAVPARSRVVGFGKASVYVIRRDDLDLEYLERYPLPD